MNLCFGRLCGALWAARTGVCSIVCQVVSGVINVMCAPLLTSINSLATDAKNRLIFFNTSATFRSSTNGDGSCMRRAITIMHDHCQLAMATFRTALTSHNTSWCATPCVRVAKHWLGNSWQITADFCACLRMRRALMHACTHESPIPTFQASGHQPQAVFNRMPAAPNLQPLCIHSLSWLQHPSDAEQVCM